MKSDKEIVGTLLGFDDFVSILFMEQDTTSCCGSLVGRCWGKLGTQHVESSIKNTIHPIAPVCALQSMSARSQVV